MYGVCAYVCVCACVCEVIPRDSKEHMIPGWDQLGYGIDVVTNQKREAPIYCLGEARHTVDVDMKDDRSPRTFSVPPHLQVPKTDKLTHGHLTCVSLDKSFGLV